MVAKQLVNKDYFPVRQRRFFLFAKKAKLETKFTKCVVLVDTKEKTHQTVGRILKERKRTYSCEVQDVTVSCSSELKKLF